MPARKRTWNGRVYLGIDPDTRKERYKWVGRFPTKRERDAAVARCRVEMEAKAEELSRPAAERITCAEYVEAYLERYERSNKASSHDTATSSLRPFVAAFADRPLGSIERHEAIAWAARVPPSRVPIVVTLFNQAVDQELIDRNPFRGLGRRTRGRSDDPPPTVEELERLLGACSALGDYSEQMRALIVFGAYTGMRPSELFALEWSDIDFKANRIDVQRRLYRGGLDVPKSNKPRRIALTPPARDVLLRQPTRTEQLVFLSKTGRRLSGPTVSGYWSQVKAAAGLDFDFYLATKHYGVHLLYKLGLSTRAIAAQMGWSERAVEKLLTVYGHIDVIALEEVDRLYEDKVVPLHAVSDAPSDARATQGG